MTQEFDGGGTSYAASVDEDYYAAEVPSQRLRRFDTGGGRCSMTQRSCDDVPECDDLRCYCHVRRQCDHLSPTVTDPYARLLDYKCEYCGEVYSGGDIHRCKDGGVKMREAVRQFETGATRDVNHSKPDFWGFFSTAVVRRFGEYMHKNRLQKDGKLRDSDNWKKGIPRRQYLESLQRHVLDVAEYVTEDVAADKVFVKQSEVEDALCAVIFNAQGLLREILIGRNVKDLS